MPNSISNQLSRKISDLLIEARKKVLQTVNHTMVLTYFEIGRMIVEEEQNGNERADYGKQLLKNLSKDLTLKFGKGFSVTNLKQMRQFYLVYNLRISAIPSPDSSNLQVLSKRFEKGQTPSDEFKLSWSHYIKLMRIDDELERKFYEIEALKNNWSLRELDRQYNSALFIRLALSKDKTEIMKLSEEGQIIEKPQDAIKDP